MTNSIEFENAKKDLTLLKTDPGNEAKLKIYGLFKQATTGPCNTPKPGLLDVVGKAKWQAWKDLGQMSKQHAEKAYVEFVSGLLRSENPNYNPANQSVTSASTSTSTPTSGKYTEFLTSIEHGNIFKIMFNRPKKLNSFSSDVSLNIRKDDLIGLAHVKAPNVFCVIQDVQRDEYGSQGSIRERGDQLLCNHGPWTLL